MPRQSLHEVARRGVALLAVLLALLAVAAIGIFFLTRSYTREEEQARETLLSLKDVRAAVLDAETGLRGYVLVERSSFLAPYRSGTRAYEGLARTLRADVSEGRADFDQATETFEAWRTQFAEPVLEFLRSERRARAIGLIDSGAGKRRIDAVRRSLGNVEAAERRELDSIQDDIDQLGLALLVAMLVLAAAGLVIGTNLLRRLNRHVVSPIADLAAAAERIQEGDLAARVKPRGSLETHSVGEAFNDMAAQVEEVVVGLRELDESKSQFISTVSHELRTPLTSIIGYIELAMEELPGEDPSSDAFRQRVEFLQVAERNTRRLQTLVNDLLFLAQSEAGKLELHPAPTDLAELCTESAEAARPHARSADVDLQVETSGAVMAEVDPVRLGQVIDNLISNGIKFTPAGGRVQVSVRKEAEGVVMEVSDTGMGISREDQELLFDRFFRTAAAGEAAIQGAGLGLAIVKSIVDAHGGTIAVDSRESEGTTFRIELPARTAA